MALTTVANYITEARALLQDQTAPYRYSDDEIVRALNMAIQDARRVRAELFQAYFDLSLPQYSSGATGATVDIDPMYRTSFLFYIVGAMQLRDQEDTTDARASNFLNKFVTDLRA